MSDALEYLLFVAAVAALSLLAAVAMTASYTFAIGLAYLPVLAVAASRRPSLVPWAALLIPTMCQGLILTRTGNDRWALTLAALAAGYLVISSMIRLREESFTLPDALMIALLASAALAALVGLVTGGWETTIAGGRIWLLFPMLYFVGRWLAGNSKDLLQVHVLGAAVLVVVALYGLQQLALGLTPSELALARSDEFTSFVGAAVKLPATLRTSQELAALVLLTVPIALAYVMSAVSNTGLRVCAGLLSAVLVVVCLASLVRTAVVASLIGALVVAVVSRSGRLSSVLLIAIAVSVAIGVFVSVATSRQQAAISQRVSSISAASGDASLAERTAVRWPRVVAEIKERPIGHGVGTTNGVAIEAVGLQRAQVTDNGYLTIAYELGVVPLLGFVALLLVSTSRAARRLAATAPSLPSTQAAGALGAVAAGSTAMMVGSFVQLIVFQIVFFISLGVLVTFSSESP